MLLRFMGKRVGNAYTVDGYAFTHILGLMNSAATTAADRKSAAHHIRGRIRAVRLAIRSCQVVYDTGRVEPGSRLDRITSTQMTALERDLADLETKLAQVSR